MLKQSILLVLFIVTLTLTAVAQDFSQIPALHARATGIAGEESSNYKVFAKTLEQGARSKPLYLQALKSGTPAAKIYAALGLWTLDREQGKLALEQLVDDKEPLVLLSGCCSETITVGQVAKDLLSNKQTYVSFDSFLPRKD